MKSDDYIHIYTFIDQVGWQQVYTSSYKRAHLKVAAAEHGYYEGSQVCCSFKCI